MVTTSGYEVERIEISSLTPQQRNEWDTLHGRQTGVSNPFTSSDWVLEWYRSYVPEPARQHLLWIRDTNGALAGVAPFYEQTVGPRRLPVGRRLVLVGYGLGTALELPQVLTTTADARAVHQAVVRWTRDAGADWSEVSIARDQAWFEPGWVEDTTAEAPHYSHRAARACVVLPLTGTWDEMRGGLKRNLKESLRRSRNRLTKSGRSWHVRTLEGSEVDETAVHRFFALHSARAGFDGTTSSHPDVYADATRRDMLVRLVPKLAQAKEASLVELVVDDQVVAVQLALHSAGTSYVHSSGLNPEYWEFSAVTLLQAELVQAAITRGDRYVNFSPGPNVAKMRWSETVHVVDDFAYATGGRTAGLRFLAFSQLSAVKQYRHAVSVARANSPAPKPTPGSGSQGSPS
ncbi:CelD/BcsL family acetyltransferase involved in cellulose biosynthesis [Kineococcus rhizosphaerae]|uniref:CelD/BcsL family acetyltransferase involved in cellulose biosynthesis n=1 Tax=Kineococcus rhizosphaerae TaxID=559628 RepID=A0A2T0RAI0_9ACTN|nr:CelD/BcsL family acetyltransferase involved in cellulose biosynthesis [Kineococcus rhizosphaerae]